MFGEPILCFSSYASLPHNQGHQFSSPALRRRHCMSTLFCTPELLPVIPPNVLRYCHSGVLFLSKKLWTCFTQFIRRGFLLSVALLFQCRRNFIHLVDFGTKIMHCLQDCIERSVQPIWPIRTPIDRCVHRFDRFVHRLTVAHTDTALR